MESPIQAEDQNRQISVAEKIVIFVWKLPVFKFDIEGVREIFTNYFIDILVILIIKCRLFQLLTRCIRMESTIRTGSQNGRKSVAEEIEISGWK